MLTNLIKMGTTTTTYTTTTTTTISLAATPLPTSTFMSLAMPTTRASPRLWTEVVSRHLIMTKSESATICTATSMSILQLPGHKFSQYLKSR
jgi:hypothetical protein